MVWMAGYVAFYLRHPRNVASGLEAIEFVVGARVKLPNDLGKVVNLLPSLVETSAISVTRKRKRVDMNSYRK
jgi:hypothetical protein